MKLLLPSCMFFLLVLPACETARYPTSLELFEGKAIVVDSLSVWTTPSQPLLEYLQTPVDQTLQSDTDTCAAPTTDAVVETVNDLVRSGRPLALHQVYSKELFAPWFFAAVGSYRPDLSWVLLLDSRRRMVTVGNVSRDLEGNFFELPDSAWDDLNRILYGDDTLLQVCAELYSTFSTLPPL